MTDRRFGPRYEPPHEGVAAIQREWSNQNAGPKGARTDILFLLHELQQSFTRAGEVYAFLKEAFGGDEAYRREGVHWPVPLLELAKAVVKKLSNVGTFREVPDGSDAPSGGWEPQSHGEWGDWALPAPQGTSRAFVSRLPGGEVSLHLEYRGGVVLSRQFTREEWEGLEAIVAGRAKLWCEKKV